MSTITLPWPPLNNRFYRHRAMKGHAVVYLSPEGAQYKENAGMLALSQWHREPLQGPVELMVRLYRPKAVGDIDGPLKAILDSMSGVLYLDDKQIIRLVVDRLDDKAWPRVELEVVEVEGT